MARVRIRWRGAAKVAVVAACSLLAVRFLPTVLAPPDPPAPAADIGLPRVESKPRTPNPRFLPDGERPKGTARRGGDAGKAVISSRHRSSVATARRDPSPESAPARAAPAAQTPTPPAAASAPAPDSPPAPASAAAPDPPAPPPASDGSEEFAPH